jgi:basic membrane protein A
MRKWAFRVVVVPPLLVALALVGWAAPAALAKAAEVPKASKLRIALVLMGRIDDLAWCQTMYEGVKEVETEMGKDKVEVAITEGLTTVQQSAAAMRQYASQGFDIVIGHHGQFHAEVNNLAMDFPGVTFATGSARPDRFVKNVFPYDAEGQEGGYLVGMLAALVSKKGIAGICGSMNSGVAGKFAYGVQEGFKAVNRKGAQLRVAFTGSFDDLAKGRELAKVHLDAGADVLIGCSQQAVAAARLAQETKGTYYMHQERDQSSIAPDAALASQQYKWSKVIRYVIDRRSNGVLGGEQIVLSFKDGSLDLVWNPRVANTIPESVKKQIEDARQKIINGTIKVVMSK